MTARNNLKLTGRAAELTRIRNEKGTLLPLLKEQMLLDADTIPDGRRMDLIHASELSHADLCHRAVSYRILRNEKPAEPFSFQRQNIFDEGDEIHRKWQHRMRRTGRLWGQWRCRICNATELGTEPGLQGCRYDCGHFWKYNEVPLQLDDWMLIGHADGAITDPACVVELKSVGLGTLRYENPRLLAEHTHRRNGCDVIDLDGLTEGIRRPFMTHIRQANMYAWMCSQLGYPFGGTIVFIYELKWNQQVREFTVKPSASIAEQMLREAAAIAAAVRQGKLACCPRGGCKHCEDIDDARLQENQDIHPGRAGQQESPQPAQRPGHQRAGRLGPAAQPGPAGDPPGPARPDRRRDDGPVPPAEPVAQVPAAPAGRRGNRRSVSRGESTQRRGGSTGPQPGQDSNGDESRRPRGHLVCRGGSPAR